MLPGQEVEEMSERIETMFSEENEAWLAQILASYGVTEPFACVAEVFAALKGAAGE